MLAEAVDSLFVCSGGVGVSLVGSASSIDSDWILRVSICGENVSTATMLMPITVKKPRQAHLRAGGNNCVDSDCAMHTMIWDWS